MQTARDFGLNRIIRPDLPLIGFIRFAAECSARYVEIRNDLADPSLLGGESPEQVRAVCEETGISILTVNALQRFNDPALLQAKKDELREMMETAASVGCRQIVLCPVNDPADGRGADDRHRDLVAALKGYAPLFEELGMIGLVEPLGFAISSLRFKKQAAAGIAASGRPELYRIVHDTFHHYLSGETEVYPAETGLIHASGVPGGKLLEDMTDDDRVLIGENDVMDNRSQVAELYRRGCTAELSYEPFSPEMSRMSTNELRARLTESLKYLFVE